MIVYNMGNAHTNDLSDMVNRSNEKIKNDVNRSLDDTKHVFEDTFSQDHMNKFDDDLVHGLKEGGHILGDASNIGDQVLNNPFANIVSNIPIAGQVVSGLRLANTGLEATGALSDGLSDVADRHEYEGKSDTDITKNLLEKSIKTGENVAGTGIQFH